MRVLKCHAYGIPRLSFGKITRPPNRKGHCLRRSLLLSSSDEEEDEDDE